MQIRKTFKPAMVLMLALLLTNGCASRAAQDETSSAASGNKLPDAALDLPDKSVNTTTDNSDNANSNAALGSKPDEQSSPPTAKPAVSAPKKLYKMNKVYSFVPIHKGETSENVVLLTFDDGPKEDEMISSLLDTLDKHKAKAVFFVNGYRVKRHPELLKKIADRGQTIGNHSWDHIDLKKEKGAVVKKQIGDVQEIVKKVTGKEPVFFRPPFGSGNDSVKSIVRGYDMLYMTWSDGSLDWDKSTKDKPDKVIANVLEQLHPGVNILMHELPWTTKALDTLLTKLESKGYGFIDPATIDPAPLPNAQNAK
ncbi:polysaccharide deacetylase family protein [Paenibacillus sp. R14(2021)]|uniref:polysaccharide deacetylase family protein n=1 Tax=Paenibacillus sp. R14(2021) TaxID=2859228 RepID=UPI001C61387E|nr:polysaccharide deacetylase family protein [Paenibacillus sp. R14(2021)]